MVERHQTIGEFGASSFLVSDGSFAWIWTFRLLMTFWMIAWAPRLSAEDFIADPVSPLVSYQFSDDYPTEVLTSDGVQSPIVSFLFLEDFSNDLLTSAGVVSRSLSYQYFDSPDDSILQWQNTSPVSYVFQEVSLTGASLKPSPTTPAAVVFAFDFPTDFGESYLVTFKNTLNEPVWKLLRIIIGDGELKTFSEQVRAGLPGRFYKLEAKSKPFLSFPLKNRSAYTARMNSVFDHSMSRRFCPDKFVIAYTGETGKEDNGSHFEVRLTCSEDESQNDLFSFAQGGLSHFSVRNQYDGGGTPQFLAYDGHPGYDYRTKDQSPDGIVDVLAAAHGTVCQVASDYGTVIIDHGNGYQTVYLHLSEFFFDGAFHPIGEFYGLLNRVVDPGDVIGKSGGTGSGGLLDAFPRHLHFEVREKVNGVFIPVDPYGWGGSGDDPYTSKTEAVNVKLWLD